MVSLKTIQGAGGLPVGTSGRAMLMLSGGIDSPVAGYLAMKRGMEIQCVHFASPPYTSPQALEKTKLLAAKLLVWRKYSILNGTFFKNSRGNQEEYTGSIFNDNYASFHASYYGST